MAPRPPLVALKNVRLQDGQRPLFDGVDIAVEPRTRAALVGRNGAGKSTLMKMVMGLIEPDAGERSVQAGVRFAYVPQEPEITGDTLLDYAVSGDAQPWTAEAWLTTFGLDAAKPAVNLSGGEIRRAALAKAFAEEPDLLLLDEPTNHLDILAIELLENELLQARLKDGKGTPESVTIVVGKLREGKCCGPGLHRPEIGFPIIALGQQSAQLFPERWRHALAERRQACRRMRQPGKGSCELGGIVEVLGFDHQKVGPDDCLFDRRGPPFRAFRKRVDRAEKPACRGSVRQGDLPQRRVGWGKFRFVGGVAAAGERKCRQ